MSWMAQAAYDRGSFATLLGVQYFGENRQAKVFAVGDCIAALCDGYSIVSTFPLCAAEQFGNSPLLISTNLTLNTLFSEENFPDSRTEIWDLSALQHPKILCMTDALGHWFLSHHESGDDPVSILEGIKSRKEFSTYVLSERIAHRLKTDDTTLIILS